MLAAGIARPALLDGVWALRDRLLASVRFQRWASGFALTRPVARRRARALFDVCAGFVYSQVLFACVQVDLFTVLFEAPLTLQALSHRIGLSLDATTRLVDAAVALRLVSRRRGGRVGLGPLGAAMVGNPGIAAMVRHHALLYGDLADPVALLRGEPTQTALSDYWAYARAVDPAALEAAQVADYSRLMAASQAMIAGDVLDAYPFHRHRALLDVGGGEGAFLQAAAARCPGLALTLFDLPAVAARAAARLAAAGVRAEALGGDFFVDALPSGADLITLLRVVHDHDEAAALTILRAARAALAPGGTLLLAEPMSETAGAEPIGDAYFGFYLLAMGSGRARSASALTSLLHQAGFAQVRRLRTRRPMLTGLLRARA